jgi:ubiquinone/menaquinone biosynthesis C-methylase UbiE/predicted  nucleic acid-binding Zn-ribbon protein
VTTREVEDSADLEFTGERFMPEISGQIAFEHLHRYYFAGALVAGRAVLDVACGEGYGSDILARSAASVVGVDIAEEAVGHARVRYGSDNLSFVTASAAALPFADASFDVVVSFETIEHHDQHEAMMSEIRRVLRPSGLLVISSPNKLHYSVEPDYHNPYHVKELFREEFTTLVGRYFPHHRLFGQRVVHGSLLVSSEDAAGTQQAFGNMRLKNGELIQQADLAVPLYDLLVASDRDLPELRSSLFEVTVHGMDPAGFYGVHLPERVSVADNRIAQLDQELGKANETRGHLERLDAGLASVGGRLESLFAGMESQLAEVLTSHEAEQVLAADILRLGSELDSTLERISQLQERLEAAENRVQTDEELLAQANQEIGSLQERLEAAENRVQTGEELLAQANQGIGILQDRLEVAEARALADGELLVQARQTLDLREAQLRDLHNSTSWRATAWLRAISTWLPGGKR